jgi:tight adherence protein C
VDHEDVAAQVLSEHALIMNLSDTNTRMWLVLAIWLAIGIIGYVIYRRWRVGEESRRRVYSEDQELAESVQDDVEKRGFLARWLYLAGFRSRGATATFVAATLICAAVGLGFALTAQSSGLTSNAIAAAESVPGGIGDLARPILLGGPWICLILWASLPWWIVNARRKDRVESVEHDMPVTLELLATMSEAGLGFDGALEKVVESQREPRPLFDELRTFQLEILGGVSRVLCFRRLARRLEVPSMSIFVSALVQAEQVGAGFSNVLRTQADDLRNRRREDANMLAQALPVKLIFPLVICFLPGIFVVTLGPIFMQFIRLADSMMSGH